MKAENRLLLLFLFIAGLFFTWLAYHSTKLAGGEDGIQHYLIAKYAFQHPENFFDHWGKPLFTLIASPFAQFGLFGVQMMNVFCGLAAAWFTYRALKTMGWETAWMAPVLLLITPLYLYAVPSAITEILFSLIVIFAFYLALKGHYIWSAVLISFLPFARTEGNIIVLMFAFGLIHLKAWKALPFLLLGTLCYSFVGSFHFNDIFWVWTENPYTNKTQDIYGSGPFLHYFNEGWHIWGGPIKKLWVLGSVLFTGVMLYSLITRKKWTRNEILLLWMVFGSFFAYLFGHSYVWYKGLSGSLGLTRVMAGTLPLAIIIALYVPEKLLSILNPRLKILKIAIVLVFLYKVIPGTYSDPVYPYTGDVEREAILKVGDWYRNSEFYKTDRKVYFFAPSAAQAFDVDPFNPEQKGILKELTWDKDIPKESLVLWEAHFGPNECRLPLDSMHAYPKLESIYTYIPDSNLTTFNNYRYEIHLFVKK